MPDESNDGKIRITSDDLAEQSVDDRLAEMDRARQVSLVRDVGTPTKGGSAGRAILTLTIGGAVGGALAFVLQRLLFNSLGLFEDNTTVTNVGFTFVLALMIGVGVSMADVIGNRTWGKIGSVAAIAIPTAIGAGLVLGFVAHLVYTTGTEWIYDSAFELVFDGELVTDQQIEDYVLLRLHPVRGLAWLFVGVAAGISAGAASRSWKRVGLATLGGAVGGFLGGFLFDFFNLGEDAAEASELLAQFVGIVLVGLLIGLATGLVEQAGKSRWIEIIRGGLAGKQFILYKSTISLGSSPSADITLIKDPKIPPIAAQITAQGEQCRISAAVLPPEGGASDAAGLVLVNGQPVGQADISDMDVVTIAGTELRFREKAQKSKIPGALK